MKASKRLYKGVQQFYELFKEYNMDIYADDSGVPATMTFNTFFDEDYLVLTATDECMSNWLEANEEFA